MLPVLVGLAVDYAIQFQARFNEARAEGAPPGRAVAVAAAGGGPVIGAACVATVAGFAVFALSPSPLVRSFGLLLVIGVALAFVVALTGGLAALGLSACRGPAPAAAPPWREARGQRGARPQGRPRVAAIALGDREPEAGAGGRSPARGLRLDRQRRHRRGDRHPRPGTSEPGRARGPERAREGDRDLGRRQRDDPGARPDQPGCDLLGRGLPAARSGAPRLLRCQPELRRRPDLPGALPDGLLRRLLRGLVVLDLGPAGQPERGRRPRSRPGAAVLHLPDRDQPSRRVQPHGGGDPDRRHGRHRLWHSRPAALRPAEPDRRHPRADRPAGRPRAAAGDHRRARRTPGARGRRRTPTSPTAAGGFRSPACSRSASSSPRSTARFAARSYR